ncbi:MAG: Rrf2 family transcriptional regulator [Clostridiaceae bacterium]
MKVSTKGTYGLKALVDLAMHSSDDVVTLKSICERQGMSERYLEQIFSLLRKNGIIKGRKGSQGGYVLSKSANELTLVEILTALEGDLVCITPTETLDHLDKTMKNFIWNKVDDAVINLLSSRTLKDLVDEYNKSNPQEYMYYI